MKRSKTSKAWMKEHVNDFFVKQAKKEGYRSRAAYKLIEIAERDHLLAPGMTIVDLGAAPGDGRKWPRKAGRKRQSHRVDLREMAAAARSHIHPGRFHRSVGSSGTGKNSGKMSC